MPLGKIIGTTVIENKEFLKELLDIEPTVSFVNQQVSQFCFALILVLLKVNAMIFTNSLFVFFFFRHSCQAFRILFTSTIYLLIIHQMYSLKRILKYLSSFVMYMPSSYNAFAYVLYYWDMFLWTPNCTQQCERALRVVYTTYSLSCSL